MTSHSMVAVVPVGEAVQYPFVDPSTVKAGHSGAEWKNNWDMGSFTSDAVLPNKN